jgi:pimeloyl-ACP methyl ester carboxylesterase
MWIDLPSGPVFAATAGRVLDRGRRTIMLLHGAGMDRTVWAWQVRALAGSGWNALALDLPGHGRSPGPALATVESMADHVWEIADRLSLGNIALAGHSLGSLIALEAASRQPHNCDGLGLVATALEMRVHPDLIALAEVGDHQAIDRILDWSLPPAHRMGATGAPGFMIRTLAERVLEAARPGVLAQDLRAADSYRGAAAAAERLSLPVVMILGLDDKMTPPSKAAPLADRLRARRFDLPAVGHMMMLEAPAATTGALRTLG